MWLFFSLAFADEQYSIESIALQAMQQPDSMSARISLQAFEQQLQYWKGTSPQGYSRALFVSPSLLTNINYQQIEHQLLPNVEEERQHDFIQVDTDSHKITIAFVNNEFEIT